LILGSVYRHQSNMQTLAGRFLVGYPYDGEWHMPNVQVVSVHVDQLERQADAAPSPYQLAMTGAKVAPPWRAVTEVIPAGPLTARLW
jgi:hypothetical protein